MIFKILSYSLLFILAFAIGYVGFSYYENQNNVDEASLGILYLKPSEKEMIPEIRKDYDGIIVIPETMEIYGKTEKLNEEQGNIIREIIEGWKG